MAIYLVSGKLGSGKTLASVGQIRDALRSGRRVATNLDLHLENMLPAKSRAVQCVRLPDKPTVEHLEMIGIGNESMDETKNGIIILDELAAWLNSRTFNDKTRAPVIDWLIHSRKKGWDVFFICQHIEQIDKQIRTALVEYLVTCRRLDRIKIPLVGKLVQGVSGGLLTGNLPKIHVAIVKYGTEQHAPTADRWMYQAKDLYQAYNTRQIFTDSYQHGVYTYLTPWHLKGWKTRTTREKLRDWWEGKTYAKKPLAKEKHPLAAKLANLPESEAIRHFKRLDALGAFQT